ncbi:MAG TPA: cupin domain-containing protein [Burkholderiaceae bacterium]|jgi:gentisate 1,2-dioxygenase
MNASYAPTIEFESARTLDELHAMLDGIQVKNGWNKPTPSLYPQPKQRFAGARWRYADARAALHAAGRLVGTEWAERRNLILANPIPGNDYPTVTTLVAAYQMVKGGETARSHRHTPNAMRVVVEADAGTHTIVDGVKVPMLHGDVLLTPNWSYHGHSNDSAHEAYWIDILDAPLVQALGPMFFEHHPDQVEAADRIEPASTMRFAYAEYRPRLLATAPVSPGLRRLELGAGRVETFDRVAMHLEAGADWPGSKSTASRILLVVDGRGSSTIGGQRFDWAPGDVLAVPSWMEHAHHADDDAVVICVSDAPVMRALRWLRD